MVPSSSTAVAWRAEPLGGGASGEGLGRAPSAGHRVLGTLSPAGRGSLDSRKLLRVARRRGGLWKRAMARVRACRQSAALGKSARPGQQQQQRVLARPKGGAGRKGRRAGHPREAHDALPVPALGHELPLLPHDGELNVMQDLGFRFQQGGCCWGRGSKGLPSRLWGAATVGRRRRGRRGRGRGARERDRLVCPHPQHLHPDALLAVGEHRVGYVDHASKVAWLPGG